MQSGYALPVSTGSMLLNKFTSTSSECFNHSVHNLQDKVKRMERKYKLTDLKAMIKDPEYHLLGPLGIIAFLQRNTQISWQKNSGWLSLQ